MEGVKNRGESEKGIWFNHLKAFPCLSVRERDSSSSYYHHHH